MKVGEWIANNAITVILALITFLLGIALTQVRQDEQNRRTIADVLELKQRTADDLGKLKSKMDRVAFMLEALCSKQAECAARYPAMSLAKED